MPVGSNGSTVDLKPFKLAVTSVIPVDLNLVVAVFDQRCALTPLSETAKILSTRSVRVQTESHSAQVLNVHFYTETSVVLQ